MKYTIALLIVIFCCSFTICDKMVVKDGGKGWIIYIYPDCSDSTTYIKSEYYISDEKKERRVPSKEWIIRKKSVSVSEYFFFHNDLLYESYYHLGDDAFYSESISVNKHWMHNYSVSPQLSGEISLHDSIKASIQHFKNGTIQSCQFGVFDRLGRSFESVEWDTTHQYKWSGFIKTVPGSTDSIEIDSPSGEYGYEVIVSQRSEKTGTWKKYNNTGTLLDSVVYK